MRHPTLLTLALAARRKPLLSAQQTEALEWYARGRSTSETATAMGVPQQDVTALLNGAARRLQAAGSAQAVAKALALELLFRGR
ncbi:hypothetical protein [Kitasatospora sp. MAP5-34]|uniref:hypothetical protein n=1 Tax=Kitasatospora sp. MAP5-34 TaxID=3035102 RepID=UPI002474F20C|nr:hypothetical protein [Kitasatospora sp. MAP5-34]MDH6576661.1 DNA-binding CsgD family transcriptional regulator [Kitasatospora sp. MAP5-34]